MISKRFVHGQPQARKSCTAAEASDSIKALLNRIHTISHTDAVYLRQAIDALNDMDGLESTQDIHTSGKTPAASTPLTTTIAIATAMEENQQDPDNKTNETKKNEKRMDKEDTNKQDKKSGKKRSKPPPERDNNDDEKRDKKKKKT